MPNRAGDLAINQKSVVRLITLAAIIIFVAGFWLWWHGTYLGQQNVFWGMIDNNLATTNITRHIVQKNQTETLDQFIQLEFGAVNATHALVKLTQTDPAGKTVVKSETIGTPKVDYNRYLSIDTAQKTSSNKPIDTSSIIGVWSKGQPGNSQYFNQGVLSIVPFGNFNQSTRHALLQYIKDHKVYNVTGTPKSSKFNGRSVYVYSVDVTPTNYIETMIQYAKELGLGELGLDPSQYQGSPALKVEFTVDKLSRHLLKIYYPSDQQEEDYFSQGLEQQLAEPTKTIPLSELQTRIQSVLQ